MQKSDLIHIKTITEFHRIAGLPKPEHPLISLVDYRDLDLQHISGNIVCNTYSIAIKKGVNYGLKYGQNKYDFDEGVMSFMAPNQVIKVEGSEIDRSKASGWILFIHPDFLWNTVLASKIHKYEYFNYSIHEALFLSDKEQMIITSIVQNIRQEYHGSIDVFSQEIILSQVETLLNYSDRFYQRQFITRKVMHHQILERAEALFNTYFDDDNSAKETLMTVKYIAESLNVSASYLNALLKSLTGQTTQQLIQDRLIGKAKEKLTTTTLTVSEIAFTLGFEHSQSFSKLFKNRTRMTPLQYRRNFD